MPPRCGNSRLDRMDPFERCPDPLVARDQRGLRRPASALSRNPSRAWTADTASGLADILNGYIVSSRYELEIRDAQTPHA